MNLNFARRLLLGDMQFSGKMGEVRDKSSLMSEFHPFLQTSQSPHACLVSSSRSTA